jgi:predicted TIM-barrel fold metal-dependent hydrolase
MSTYRIISSDNHVFELPDLWQSRIESKFKDRAPQIHREEDGDWWYCDGKKLEGAGFGSAGAQTGRRFEEAENLTHGDLFENIRPGGYIPEEQIKDMEVDGVDVGILYPTAGLQLYKIRDGLLLTAMFRTYNDWVAEFCEVSPDSLKGIAMINIDDVNEGAADLEHCANQGFVGAMIPVYPPKFRRYDSLEYDRFWGAAQDLEMPLSLHVATNRYGSGENDGSETGGARVGIAPNQDFFPRVSISDMILSGVFERFPKLQVGVVEHELSWVPFFLTRLDYTYNQQGFGREGYRFKEDMQPSDYFHRNIFLGFQEDELGIRLRDIIGVDNLQWGADYPHMESTFPKSQAILEEILADCTEEEKSKIAGGNAARVYRL